MPDREGRPTKRYARESGRRLRRDPGDADALFARAAVLAAVGARETALALLDRLTSVAPGYPGVWRFKARLHAERGDPRMEALCLAAAEREDPGAEAGKDREGRRPAARDSPT